MKKKDVLAQCRILNMWVSWEYLLTAQFHASDSIYYCSAHDDHPMVLREWYRECNHFKKYLSVWVTK